LRGEEDSWEPPPLRKAESTSGIRLCKKGARRIAKASMSMPLGKKRAVGCSREEGVGLIGRQ